MRECARSEEAGGQGAEEQRDEGVRSQYRGLGTEKRVGAARRRHHTLWEIFQMKKGL